MMMVILFMTSALIVISVTTLLNVVMLPHLRTNHGATAAYQPLVSILIPARNEASVISKTIQHLLAQDYTNFELLLLDDSSEDDTVEVAKKAAGGDNRFTVIPGEPLPTGWMGKNWACHQLQRHATGDILIFTDADVIWAAQALRALVQHMQKTRADLVTVWPTQHTDTWGERLVVPLMAMVVVGYLPVIGTHYIPLSAFGAANGQCMAWRRNAYDQVGGHQAVSDNVLEDVTLARMVKANALRLRMADGGNLIRCRMYDGWPAVRDGFAKNILAGYGNSIPLLMIATVFHWLLFIYPWAWLIFGGIEPHPMGPLSLIAMGILIRGLTAAYSQQRVPDALLLPISVILMTRIAMQSIYWQVRHGGPQWKGRVVRRNRTARNTTHG
ncbi:MAG: glycosyltransferase [Chloroflexota bacterium]